MARSGASVVAEELWRLAARQHGVAARRQLLDLGLSPDAIEHRVATGRLHPVARGVYAVGRPGLGQTGRRATALLACGPTAALSHESAAAAWGIRTHERTAIEVTVPAHMRRTRPGVTVYRRALAPDEVTLRDDLRLTALPRTLVDLAPRLGREPLEAAINAADKEGLIDPEALRAALPRYAGRPGIAALRRVLDRRTFVLTDSQLERRFLPLARSAGLPKPETGRSLNGFKVDFFWPELGLVVETDGLRYHRTPAEQARDRLRDQAHAAAGLTPLRFTHAQVRYEAKYVVATLAAVVRRLRGAHP